MSFSLLPSKSDLLETAIETTLAERWAVLSDAVPAIRIDKLSPPPSFLPYVVWEFGLGELTPYVPNLYDLLEEGIQWQRVRGTFEAVARGLAWIGYSANVEVAWHGRVWWNSFQLRFPSLPASDSPDLERIEGIAQLSVPKRSQLRRGVYHYDVGACELDRSCLDDCMFERESGVAVTPAGTLWSFGRAHEISHLLTEAEGVALGNWIEPVDEGSLRWVDMTYPWTAATFPWVASAATQRRVLMAAWFSALRLHVVLRDGNGDVIGFRRCRAVHPVRQEFGGAYSFDGARYEPVSGGTRLYVEAMTDFEDAADVTAASVSLLVDGEFAAGIRPGRLWLQPGDISGGIEFAATAISIPLRATVREQIKFLVRF